MNRCFALLLLVLLALASLAIAQDQDRWDIMTIKENGVDRFRAEYPDFDGSGVVVAVLDTGVDPGVEGLRTLPDGTPKVVDVRDFTGEGDLIWEEAHLVPDGKGGEKLVDSEGRSLTGFQKVAVCADPARYYMVFIEESNFHDTAVRDLNADGDTKDKFGILIFTVREVGTCKCEAGKKKAKAAEGDKPEEGGHEEHGSHEHGHGEGAAGEGSHGDETADGAEPNGQGEEAAHDHGHEAKEGENKEPACTCKPELLYVAVVDVNGDGNLEDGVLLTDYWRKHETFVLKGKKGGRQQLFMALNFYPEEKRLSVHFDDGGHGTHVAGIAAGYRIHGQEGYHGMAPGAKVISLKIGNNRFSGGCTVTESVKKALDYAVKYANDKKVPVVCNMSFGIGSERETESAIDKYVDKIMVANPNVIFVTSAGNEGPGLSSVGTPAAAYHAITVGALLGPEAAAAQYGCPLEKEVLFSFSSRGGDTFKPDILAPGSASSTVPPWGDGDHFNGTSMASPAAAGTIALLVDGLVRHDPAYEIDNALIYRAVKNTGRHVEGWTVLDEGGGALDLPAAYAYAKFLCESGEGKALRHYKISNRGPAPGFGTAYWRISPVLPRPTDVMTFRVDAGFPKGITDQDKASFYRAFDLSPDVDWLTLTKPIVYLKGTVGASVGVMADLTGKEPGLYTGKVMAYRKSPDRVSGEPIHEFDIPVSVLVPHRVTPENRGRIQMTGEVEPGFLDRFFVEVPEGTTAIETDLRMVNGQRASYVSTSVYDPEGVGRGGVGSVSEAGRKDTQRTFTGSYIVPGTWEFIVTSSMRSKAKATYDLTVSLSGVSFGETRIYAGEDGLTRKHLLVPMRCTQALPFTGTVSAKIDGFMKKEVVEVHGEDHHTFEVCLDNTMSTASWNVDFDRETYALFTDCVFRIEDPETDKVIRNGSLGQRSGSVRLSINKNQTTPKKYRIILMPGFSLESDTKHWKFELTERLTPSLGSVKVNPIHPKSGRITLMPHDWANLEFALPDNLPDAPKGYALRCVLEASGSQGVICRKTFGM